MANSCLYQENDLYTQLLSRIASIERINADNKDLENDISDIISSETSWTAGLKSNPKRTYQNLENENLGIIDWTNLYYNSPKSPISEYIKKYLSKKNFNDEENSQSATDIVEEETISKDSTDTNDINALNKCYKDFLDKHQDSFLRMLRYTNFEDGMTNDAIEETKRFLSENKYVTICWLNELYSKNQKDQEILESLLRVIGMAIGKEDSDTLLPIVIAGLTEVSSKTQEAAIMVIEEWRTESCLQALKNRSYNSDWIRNYANEIISELQRELNA